MIVRLYCRLFRHFLLDVFFFRKGFYSPSEILLILRNLFAFTKTLLYNIICILMEFRIFVKNNNPVVLIIIIIIFNEISIQKRL